MKSLFRFFIPLAFLCSTFSLAQIQHDGTPWSNQTALSSTVATLAMPAQDVRTLLEEDRVAAASKDIPFPFGYPFMLDYGFTNSVTWDILPDGRRIWRLAISSTVAFPSI